MVEKKFMIDGCRRSDARAGTIGPLFYFHYDASYRKTLCRALLSGYCKKFDAVLAGGTHQIRGLCPAYRLQKLAELFEPHTPKPWLSTDPEEP